MTAPWEKYSSSPAAEPVPEGPWSRLKADEPMTVAGGISNAARDAVDIGKGVANAARMAMMAPTAVARTAFNTGRQLLQGVPPGKTDMGQQLDSLGNLVVSTLPHPNPDKPLAFKNLEPGGLLENVLHPYEHPLKALIDVASVVAPAAKAMKGAETASAASKAGEASSLATKAQDLGVNALGYGKGMLKTPQAVAKARDVAQTMMDQDILKTFTTPEGMAGKVKELASTSGKAIGGYLESVGTRGKFFDAKQAIDSIEELRPTSEAGKVLKGGYYDALNTNIDNAIATIKAHGKKPLSFEDANKLKGTLQDAANWKNNKDATLLDRMIAGKFRESLDNALNNVSNTDRNKVAFQDFLTNKKLYSAAMQAQDPLYNRISAHLANNGISLSDFILAAPELAVGNPMKALKLMGGRRIIQQFGSQAGASALNAASKAKAPVAAPAVLRALETIGNSQDQNGSLLDVVKSSRK